MSIELQNYLKEKRSKITTDSLKFWKANSQNLSESGSHCEEVPLPWNGA